MKKRIRTVQSHIVMELLQTGISVPRVWTNKLVEDGGVMEFSVGREYMLRNEERPEQVVLVRCSQDTPTGLHLLNANPTI